MNNNMIIKMLADNGINAEEVNVEKGGRIVKGISIGDGIERMVAYPDRFDSEREFVNTVIAEINNHRTSGIDVNQIINWNNAKDNVLLGIRPQIYGTNLVTEKWCDLELYVYINFENATVKINAELLINYGITKETLFTKAKENTRKIVTMNKLDNFLGISDSDIQIYYVTTKNFVNGAAAICDIETANMVCNKMRTNKLFIIPSSIHETLIINAHKYPIDYLVPMVREVNQSCVAPTEILSDNIYIYDRTTESFKVYSGN